MRPICGQRVSAQLTNRAPVLSEHLTANSLLNESQSMLCSFEWHEVHQVAEDPGAGSLWDFRVEEMDRTLCPHYLRIARPSSLTAWEAPLSQERPRKGNLCWTSLVSVWSVPSGTFLCHPFSGNRLRMSGKTVLVAQLCLILCDRMDCSPPGSSVHGILQARILEWVAIPLTQGSQAWHSLQRH